VSKNEIDAIKYEIGKLKSATSAAEARLEAAELCHAGLTVGDWITVKVKLGEYEAQIFGWHCDGPIVQPIIADGSVCVMPVYVPKDGWKKL